MEIIFKGRHTNVPERFRQHAATKLAKIEKLDPKTIRIDVEVTQERNPRQSDRRERVELTIRSRGPAIRAEASADDRYTALDLAFAKLESRLRRVCDRRKIRHADHVTVRSPGVLAGVTQANGTTRGMPAPPGIDARRDVEPDYEPDYGPPPDSRPTASPASAPDHLIPIQMEGDGPLVVREKSHFGKPMPIDQALLEMELVGHDFYLFHDSDCGSFSVVYRRRGYDYGVIRLVEE